MRTRLGLVLMAAALAPTVVAAKDVLPPHDVAYTSTSCYYCHSLHVDSPGGSDDYNPGCVGCHNQDGHKFGMPWSPESEQAVPGVSGASHSWTGMANNPTYGAISGLLPAQYLLVDGALQCAVCHDIHEPTAPVDPNSMHTSIPVGELQPPSGAVGAGPGTAQLVLTVPPGTKAEGYRIKILTADATGGTFIVSHDYGFNSAFWMVWSTGTNSWVSGLEAGAVGRRFDYGATSASDVELDVAGVKVRWEKGLSGAEVGDFWDFYVGYPFLRLSNVKDNGCYTCHPERKMNHTRARGIDNTYLPNGVRKFSHPVEVGLNINGFDRDRTTTLDVDGVEGISSADGLDASLQPVRNDTNNLDMGATNLVRCTTCHSVHNTDSNSLTVDVR